MKKAPTFLALLLGAFFLAVCSEVTQAGEYEPGRGLHINDDVRLGGYSFLSLELRDDKPNSLELGDLSAFLWLRFNSDLKLFSEFELEDSFRIESDGPHTGKQASQLERLYVEYDSASGFDIKLGKLLTPIGTWNQIHAAPLVWSTSRPFTTRMFFDTGITGVQLNRTFLYGGLDVNASVFGQFTDQLDEGDGPQRIRRGIGGRLLVNHQEQWQLALSYLRFEDEMQDRWEHVLGSDFMYRSERWEFSGETVVNDPGSGGKATWGAYLQSVYKTGTRIYPFLRLEHAELDTDSGSPATVGFAWKWSSRRKSWPVQETSRAMVSSAPSRCCSDS
ncbi:MAG: hypothetical protein ACE5D3_07065 [Candidatus Binatia bacterium]